MKQAIAALETGGGGGGVNNIDFVFAYKTGSTEIQDSGTWEDITFNTNGQINGWTHTGGSANFTCPTTGIYECLVKLTIEETDNGSVAMAVRGLFNAVEIAGSHKGVDLNHTNTALPLETNFMFSGTASQILKIQWSADEGDSVFIKPGPDPAAATTEIAGTIVIRRIT